MLVRAAGSVQNVLSDFTTTYKDPAAQFESRVGAHRVCPCPNDGVAYLALRIREDPAQLYRALAACPRVRRPDLNFPPPVCSPDYFAVVQDRRVARLPTVLIHPEHSAIPYFAIILQTHLPGPLGIKKFDGIITRHNEALFDVVLCDAASSRQRSFVRTILDLSSDSSDLAQVSALGIADRLVELRMRVKAIDVIAALFPSLPVLDVFVIALGRHKTGTVLYPGTDILQMFYAANMRAVRPVACPVLSRVVIEGDGQMCSTTWIAQFVGHALGVSPRRKLELVLKGCSLDGDPGQIWGYFKSISMVPNSQ
ncbi:hypothetical protein AURDEDRAFT_162455 [Auricularia subglabra TFB-10046 SS5]|nr:hypothetical protein AURDEDRAFT_162455 [Auricularia subglabra TFB-10046 SS5]